MQMDFINLLGANASQMTANSAGTATATTPDGGAFIKTLIAALNGAGGTEVAGVVTNGTDAAGNAAPMPADVAALFLQANSSALLALFGMNEDGLQETAASQPINQPANDVTPQYGVDATKTDKASLLSLLSALLKKAGIPFPGETTDGKDAAPTEGPDTPSADVTAAAAQPEKEPAEGRSVQELLAVLLFASLQSMAKLPQPIEQNAGTDGASVQLALADAAPSAVPQMQQQPLPLASQLTGDVLNVSSKDKKDKAADELIEELLKAAGITDGSVPQEEAAAKQTIVAAPMMQEAPKDGSVFTFVVKAPAQAAAEKVQPVAAGAGSQAQSDTAEQKGSENVLNGVFITHSASLVEPRAEDAPFQENLSDKPVPAPADAYQTVAMKETGSAGKPQEEKAPMIQQAPGAAGAERVEKVSGQIAARPGNVNDFRVRLDLGNHESLVLGMKDVGENINVEVRASHQGIATLLQSQKEAIVRHLEGKDIRTSIYVDPDGSQTSERRERRETKQQLFTGKRRDKEEFGAFMEIFA